VQACASFTAEADVNTEATLEAALMHKRTVFFGGDIYLSATLYVLIGVNARMDFALDGKGLWKLDGQDSVRCLFISGNDMSVRLKDLTVTNGYASASSTFGYYGGAIYVGDGAVLEMDGCTVSSSSTASFGQGAGIYVNDAILTLANTVVEFNVMYYGKGAGVYLASSSVLSMIGGSITFNFARSASCYTSTSMEGGGLYVEGGSKAIINDGASIDNNIAYKGGGVFVASDGELVFLNASLTENSYSKLYLGTTYYAMYRSGCSSSYAYQSYGGGVFVNSNAKVVFAGSKVSSNVAYYHGGGLYFSSGTTALFSECVISSNYAQYQGGGMYTSSATTIMNDSAIESNTLAGTSSR
jgi:hypothetical protein